MLFEEKLKQILKNETSKLVIFSIVPIILIPFIIWYLEGDYNIPTIWNKIGFAILYSLLIIMVVRESFIVRELKWSIENYKDNPEQVHHFLQERKRTLDLYHGHNKLIVLYEEALNLFKNLKFNTALK